MKLWPLFPTATAIAALSATPAHATCSAWTQLGGGACASSISTSSPTNVWATGCETTADKTIWSYNGSTWTGRPGGAVQVSVGADVWVRTSAGYIYKWNGSSWGTRLKNAAQQDACGSYIGASRIRGSLGVIACGSGADKDLWLYHGEADYYHGSNTWSSLGSTAAQVADFSLPTQFDSISTHESVWYRKSTGVMGEHHYPGIYTGLTGSSSLMMNGSNDTLYVKGTDNNIWRYDGNGAWAVETAAIANLKSFSVNSSQIWATNTAGAIFRCTLGPKPKATVTNDTSIASAIQARSNTSLSVAMGAAVVINGNIYANVAGMRSANSAHPVKIDDRWELGSIGKVFTGELLATFIDDGALSWDDTLDDVLAQLFCSNPMPDPACVGASNPYRYATIQEYLSHTSGLHQVPATFSLWDEADFAGVSLDARRYDWIRDFALIDTPQYPLGTYENYGQGPIFAAAMLEEVTNTEYELLMPRLYSRAGMTNTNYDFMVHDFNFDGIYSHTVSNSGNTVVMPPQHGHRTDQAVGWPRASVLDLARFGYYVAHSHPELRRTVGLGRFTPTSWGMTMTNVANGVQLDKNGSNGENYARIQVWPDRDVVVVAMTNYQPQVGNAPEVDGLLSDLRGLVDSGTWPGVLPRAFPQAAAPTAGCGTSGSVASSSTGLAAQAFDRSYGTSWTSGFGTGWVQCDLAAPVTVSHLTFSESSLAAKGTQPPTSEQATNTYAANSWSAQVYRSTTGTWTTVASGDYIGARVDLQLSQAYSSVTKVRLNVGSSGIDTPSPVMISEFHMNP